MTEEGLREAAQGKKEQSLVRAVLHWLMKAELDLLA